jgi:hypothetical protein
MSDIVERLRSADVLIVKSATDLRSVVAEEAADEIERLRAENAKLAASNHAYLSDYQEARGEIEKLRAALQTAQRDALKEAWLVIANKSALETPASFEDILQRDIEMMNAIRALGEKE